MWKWECFEIESLCTFLYMLLWGWGITLITLLACYAFKSIKKSCLPSGSLHSSVEMAAFDSPKWNSALECIGSNTWCGKIIKGDQESWCVKYGGQQRTKKAVFEKSENEVRESSPENLCKKNKCEDCSGSRAGKWNMLGNRYVSGAEISVWASRRSVSSNSVPWSCTRPFLLTNMSSMTRELVTWATLAFCLKKFGFNLPLLQHFRSQKRTSVSINSSCSYDRTSSFHQQFILGYSRDHMVVLFFFLICICFHCKVCTGSRECS